MIRNLLRRLRPHPFRGKSGIRTPFYEQIAERQMQRVLEADRAEGIDPGQSVRVWPVWEKKPMARWRDRGYGVDIPRVPSALGNTGDGRTQFRL